MARRNPLRSVQSEAHLARRIAHERETRGWTYDGTAKRLTDAGCAIQGSAIYKIEKGDPPRRISVDELVAFGRVFDVEIADLLVPVDVLLDKEATRLFGTWADQGRRVSELNAERDRTWNALRAYVARHPETLRGIEAALAAYDDASKWDDGTGEFWPILSLRQAAQEAGANG